MHVTFVNGEFEFMHVMMYIQYAEHVNSVNETREGKATTPEDNSFFLKRKNELPQAGFEPATFCVLGRRSTN